MAEARAAGGAHRLHERLRAGFVAQLEHEVELDLRAGADRAGDLRLDGVGHGRAGQRLRVGRGGRRTGGGDHGARAQRCDRTR
jgi:hypothetical protein